MDKKTQINIRVTEPQREALKSNSEALGLTVSAYLLRVGLGDRGYAERLEDLENRVSRIEGLASIQ